MGRIQTDNCIGMRAGLIQSGEPYRIPHTHKRVHRQTLQFYRQTGVWVNAARRGNARAAVLTHEFGR